MTDRAPSARLTAEVYLWAPSEFPQDLDDRITLAFEQAEELLKERLHELDAIREVRCDFQAAFEGFTEARMSGQFSIRNLYVAWGHRDGLHLVGPRRHFHIFFWTRGHRRSPIYMRWLPGSRRPK